MTDHRRRGGNSHDGGLQIEVRPTVGWWFKWEGRVVHLVRWDAQNNWTREHVLPARENRPKDPMFRAGGWPYWMPSHSKRRLIKRLEDLRDEHILEQQRRIRIEVVK